MSKKEEKKVEVNEEKVTKEEKVEKVEKKETKPESKSSVNGLAIVIVLIVVFAVGYGLFKAFGGGATLETSLNNSLKKMGEEFYTEYYYPEISKDKSSAEVTTILEKFKDIGIKIDLDNLSRYNDGANEEEIAKFKNNGKACNNKTTRAIIYPKSPYGKKDYKVEVELDCGFDKKAETK